MPQNLLLRYANRHGLIAGATGTGKTITLQVLAEQFSALGVPVFLSDVKGDLSGLGAAGGKDEIARTALEARAMRIGLPDFRFKASPVTLWDLLGEDGHPVRTTLDKMGPLLVSRLLELTEAQDGVINIAFKIARQKDRPLGDIADLRMWLAWLSEHREEVARVYGNVSAGSVGAILRRLLVLEEQGGARFLGQPTLDITDLMRRNDDGAGMINILAAHKLIRTPLLYAMSLLWLLFELYESLPEVGDPEQPVLVIFFDEAHLLFTDTPKALVAQIETVTRLIRSKGVGLYFVTQNPTDVPENVLGQLGNRVQHALRAFTPKDRRALRQAAETYRDNPDLDIVRSIREVGVGEAVTSLLQEDGTPGMAQRTLIRPPASKIGPLDEAKTRVIIDNSPLKDKYYQKVSGGSAPAMSKVRKKDLGAPLPPRPLCHHLKSPPELSNVQPHDVAHRLGNRIGRTLVRNVLWVVHRYHPKR
jgi:DNA helicase HerA-like ATPase